MDQLELKLQEALLYQGRRRSSTTEDPTISYIRNFLLCDEDDDHIKEDAIPYQSYLDDLTNIIRDARSRYPEQNSSFPRSSRHQDHIAPDNEHRSRLLMEAARALTVGDLTQAVRLVEELFRHTSASSSNPRERAVFYFIQALVARLSGNGAQMFKAIAGAVTARACFEVRLLKLPAFEVMNVYSKEAILERCKGAKKLHIADFGILYGSQWPPLIKALIELPEGPPLLKITGIDYPDRVDVAATGRKLAGYAQSFGLSLEFHAIAADRWETVQLQCCPEEFLVVNFNLRLRHVPEDGTAAKNPRKLLFDCIAKLKPRMLLLCLASASLSSPLFLPRFQEALRYYTAKIEYFDTVTEENDAKALIEKIISRNIMNVVACEGRDRIEQLNSYEKWESRVRQARFKALPLSDKVCNAMRDVWNGCRQSEHVGVRRDQEWILLRWKDVNMYACSAWEPIALF